MHLVIRAASRALLSVGSSSPIRSAMIRITTSNSMSVKARRVESVRRDGMRSSGCG